MRVNVDTTGFKALADEMTRAAATIERRAASAVRKAGRGIERDAKILSPVDTGALMNSISTSETGGAGFIQVEIGPTVDYAHFVEEGTSRQNPQPYMRPATDRHLPGLEQALDQLGDL